MCFSLVSRKSYWILKRSRNLMVSGIADTREKNVKGESVEIDGKESRWTDKIYRHGHKATVL
jgi:hypothetical protein